MGQRPSFLTQLWSATALPQSRLGAGVDTGARRALAVGRLAPEADLPGTTQSGKFWVLGKDESMACRA